MTAPVFVDTNILVYARDSSEPEKQVRAREWLALLWRERRGRTSVHVLSEYYAVVTRKLRPAVPRADAQIEVESFMEWAPRQTDTDLLDRAFEVEDRHRLSWWDSIVVAAAQAQECALLLTEDLQDGANYGGVIVRNPFKLGVAEEHTAYAPVQKLASRHRGRGRPRKTPRPAAA